MKKDSNGYRVEMPDGSYRQFNLAGMPTAIKDAFGNGLTIAYATNWTIPTGAQYPAWERDPIDSDPNPPHIYNSNRRPFRGRTVFHDDGGSYAETVSCNFDGLSHYRQTDSKGSAFLNIPSPSTVLRRALQDYDATPGTYTVRRISRSGASASRRRTSGSPRPASMSGTWPPASQG